MRYEDVVVDDGEPSFWQAMPNHPYCILVGARPGGFSYRLCINPDTPWEVGQTSLEWAAGLITRIEELGFDAAMSADGWFLRSDGDYQMWGRPVQLDPSLWNPPTAGSDGNA